MNNVRHLTISLALVFTVALAGCSSSQQSDGSQAASDAGQNSKEASTSNQHYQATLALHGEPDISADGKSVVVTVDITNTGSTTFGSETTPNNVNLAAHGVDASGKIIIQDLTRGHLPQIAPGTQATAIIFLPLDKVLNKSAALLPVQENIAWFDQWGTKALVVGPFKSCSNESVGTVCDASGKPLTTGTAKQ